MSPDSNPSRSVSPPYVDCIQWIPRRFVGGPSPVTIADLVFTQAALKIVRDAVVTRPEHSVFGLLTGSVAVDPTCDRPWVEVTGVHRGPVLSGEPSSATLKTIVDGLRSNLSEGHARSIVGWYRSHPGAGLYLSPDEAALHDACFADAWGFAMILVGDTGRLTGSVFQRTDPEGLSRSVYTPFYELVDDSSEFNGTTRRTFVAWPNYQTEARVVLAGQGSVSDQLPEDASAYVEVTERPPATVTEPQGAPSTTAPSASIVDRDPFDGPAASDAPADELPYLFAGEAFRDAGPAAPAPTVDSAAEAVSPEEVEVEWEKKQIRRSLTAVGRSMGSSIGGELDTPVTVDRDDRPPVSEDAGEAGEDADGERESGSGDHVEAPVIPIRPIATAPSTPATGMVGKSRRSRRFPAKKIAGAAAGLALLGAAGWFGSQKVSGRAAALDESALSRGSSVAGLSLAPTDLFQDDTDDAVRATTSGSRSSDIVDLRRPITAERELSMLDEALQVETPLSPTTGDAPRPRPRQPQPIRAPDLGDVEIGDVEISAYEHALSIFRQEVARYEGLRAAFDEGSETCDPLDLAARGVRDSYDRLSRRFDGVAERFEAPEVRAFESAQRQKAMIDAHYGLTDCPISPAGDG
ncbi:MAG: hypothetical protein MJB57_10955 [Gemmatimonadetes bacterium]|nr:hypothetical protein [Gemmatimonadota bacterium]